MTTHDDALQRRAARQVRGQQGDSLDLAFAELRHACWWLRNVRPGIAHTAQVDAVCDRVDRLLADGVPMRAIVGKLADYLRHDA